MSVVLTGFQLTQRPLRSQGDRHFLLGTHRVTGSRNSLLKGFFILP